LKAKQSKPEASLVAAAPAAENDCRPGEPSVPSSGEHRIADVDKKHEPESAS
jgi:hypothetical protein